MKNKCREKDKEEKRRKQRKDNFKIVPQILSFPGIRIFSDFKKTIVFFETERNKGSVLLLCEHNSKFFPIT